MGKSSLGKRKTNVLPFRVSSLGNVGELPEPGPSQRGRTSVKKSYIPRLSKSRALSSSPSKDAAKSISYAGSLRRSRSNSNLHQFAVGTPMTPMYLMGSVPGTAQSSRVGGRSTMPVLKDPRPLSDKRFQNAALQRIQNYLHQNDDEDLKLTTSKALATRSLTLKVFVDFVYHLLSHFFKKHIINMSNYADEIPHLTKRLGYPGSVKKSWLITANSSHSWPNVIGLLSWLVDIVRIYRPEMLSMIMFPPEGEEVVNESILDTQTMFSYYFKCYDIFNNDEASEERMADEDNRLVHEMALKLNINKEDFRAITEEIRNLKMQLDNPEDKAARREMIELEAASESLHNDLKKQRHCVQKRDACRNAQQDKVARLLSNNDVLKMHIENVQTDISKMKHVIETQSITREDKESIESECRVLEETIKVNQACCDALSKTVYADDIKIAKLKNELNNKCVDYNTSIMEYRSGLPALDVFKMPMNFLHKDTDLIMQQIVDEMENFRTDLKMKLNEMETRAEEQEEFAAEAVEREVASSEEYDKYVKEVEDLKAEVTNLKEKVKNEEQMFKCNLKRLEEDCVDIVAKMPSVEEEEEKLKDSREKVQFMTDHISKVNEQAHSFFQKYDAIYEDLIQKLKGQMLEHMKQRESKK